MKRATSPPSAKRVRWDDSVLPDLGKSDQTRSKTEQDSQHDPAPAAKPSCSASDAIRVYSVSAAAELSAAASEKDIRVEGFRPEFTHQLFDAERIEGYEEGEITIRVHYSATSLHFLVEIETRDDSGAPGTADVLSRLSKALPPADHTTDRESFCEKLDGWRNGFKPPGARVHEYKRRAKTFSVYRATGEDPGACEYHGRAQCLAPWLIEAADSIDLADDRWEVFYLFEEETPREVLGEKWRPAALVGYFTVFGFRNPVKGVSLRICQALIVPQFQRQGHGQALLAFLYDLARSRESVFEITVEDPAPGFEKVRNLVDARTLRDHDVFPADLLASDTFRRPAKDVIQAAHEAVKLTVSQVEIGFDILKARDVEPPAEPLSSAGPPNENPTAASSDGATATGADDDRRKRYRLMVKRRLLKRHGEELSTDAPTRKRQLEDLYRDVEAGFLSLGSKIREERGGMIANGTV